MDANVDNAASLSEMMKAIECFIVKTHLVIRLDES